MLVEEELGRLSLDKDTLITIGNVFNYVEGFTTTAACSIAFTSDPAVTALGWDTAVAADTFLVGHPRAGESVRDTTYRYIPADSAFEIWGRASQLKVKGTGTGVYDAVVFFNY